MGSLVMEFGYRRAYAKANTNTSTQSTNKNKNSIRTISSGVCFFRLLIFFFLSFLACTLLPFISSPLTQPLTLLKLFQRILSHQLLRPEWRFSSLFPLFVLFVCWHIHISFRTHYSMAYLAIFTFMAILYTWKPHQLKVFYSSLIL